MSNTQINIQVPARVCLFGDHQDYLGLPVIAAAIDRFMSLTAQPIAEKQFEIHLPQIGQKRIISLNQVIEHMPANDYFLSGIKLFQDKKIFFKQGYRVTITSDIPINAGVSSSSALVVGWIRFLLSIQFQIPYPSDKTVGKMAHQAEVLHFNQPGGIMDQYTIAQRGMLFIETLTGNCVALPKSIKNLIVAESGIEKRTLKVLQKAKYHALEAINQVQSSYPEFDLHSSTVEDYYQYKNELSEELLPYWYATIHNFNITLEAKKLLEEPNPDIQKLGDLMNQHQHILQSYIKNTPSEMQNQIDAAIRSGALGAKVIGSGGGGCILALTEPQTKKQVIQAFLDAGCIKVYPIEIV